MRATPARPPWSSTYRVSNAKRSQRILRVLDRLDDPTVTALGVQHGDEHHLVIECLTATGEMRTRRLVFSLDLLAVRTATRSPADTLYGRDRPDTAYVSGASLAVPQRIAQLVVSAWPRPRPGTDAPETVAGTGTID